MADRLTIAATTHGRVLVRHPRSPGPWPAIIGFHGYGQNASQMLDDLAGIPGTDRWLLVSVQALNRFYARDLQTVVACWMTREDRETAIADNLHYVSDVVDAVKHAWPFTHLVCAGFSQGVAMAFRAGLRAGHPCDGVVALGGDIPPELVEDGRAAWPPVLLGRGRDDQFYGQAAFERDVTFLRGRGVLEGEVPFQGGHEWHPEFASRAGAFLARIASQPPG
jgi:predicted esterase